MKGESALGGEKMIKCTHCDSEFFSYSELKKDRCRLDVISEDPYYAVYEEYSICPICGSDEIIDEEKDKELEWQE